MQSVFNIMKTKVFAAMLSYKYIIEGTYIQNTKTNFTKVKQNG